MTAVLLAVGAFLLVAPRVLASPGRRLHPREQVRLSVRALILGGLLVEMALVQFALPAVLRALGFASLAPVSCQWFGNLAPDGLSVGWPAAVLAVLAPVLAWRGWARSMTEIAEMRVEPALGVHQDIDGIDVVMLPTEVPIAYGIDDGRPQIVVSQGLAALVSPSELDAVVFHEMAHIHNGDSQTLRILRAVETTLPPMRWVGHRVRVAVERSADEWATGHDRAERSTLLSALVRAVAPDDTALAVARFTGGSGVLERVTALLDPPPDPTLRQRVMARLSVASFVAVGLVAAGGFAVAAHTLLSIAGLCCT